MRQQDSVAALLEVENFFGDSGRSQHGEKTPAPIGPLRRAAATGRSIPMPLILSATVVQA
jgi:hypothetical protein